MKPSRGPMPEPVPTMTMRLKSVAMRITPHAVIFHISLDKNEKGYLSWDVNTYSEHLVPRSL